MDPPARNEILSPPPAPPAAAGLPPLRDRQFQLLGGAMFRSFRCLWMLEELGLPYEHLPGVLPQSRTIQAYHPLGKVPVLIETGTNEDGDVKPFVLYESAAINTYLGDLVNTALSVVPEERVDSRRSLVPRVGTHARGLYEQTVSCIMTELDAQGLWIHRKHHAMGKVFGYIPQAVQHAQQHFHKVNAVLAQQLVHNHKTSSSSSSSFSRKNANNNNNSTQSQYYYLVGSQFTAADILYVHCLDWSESIGWDTEWKQNATLCDYLKGCRARPAYRQVAALRTQELKDMKQQQQQRQSKL